MAPPASIRRETDPTHRLILALDVPDPSEAQRLVDALGEDLVWVKVGLELFVAGGSSIVGSMIERGKRVFLDLKFHDIPNTMGRATARAAALGVDLLTVHAAAGAGVGAAARAAAQADHPPAILAVTVLTSHAEGELGRLFESASSDAALVTRLGKAAVEQGAHGLVASPLEIVALRGAVGPTPLLVIPGIRPAGAAVGDQARVATPAAALRAGADYLVVGRPVRDAAAPRDALRRILDEISDAV
jgi:orotidine-5'-phosphate decarboxylase